MIEQTLFLVRHGKTTANEKKLYAGSFDSPLSLQGRIELLELSKCYQRSIRKEDIIFISTPSIRTKATCFLLFGENNPQILPELMEYQFGEFEGKSYEELKNCKDYCDWITDKTGEVFCPGGESRNSFSKRIEKGLLRLLQLNSPSILVVCHGGSISMIMDMLFPNQRDFYEWQPSYGMGYQICLRDKKAIFYEPLPRKEDTL